MSALNVNWVDFLVVLLLAVGFWHGRRRGMSQELLDIIKWPIIVLVGGVFSDPLGRLLWQSTAALSPLFWIVTTYVTIMLLVLFSFSMIKRGAGQKLVGSDAFGASEYYLGMMAGAFRYVCIMIAAMALLNARQYSAEEIRAKTKYQEDNFGTTFFMTLPDLQRQVFKESFIGGLAHEYLQLVLIPSTPSGDKGKSGSGGTNARARERSFPSF
jgi:uncharacterized membrane protein required for colicin V production